MYIAILKKLFKFIKIFEQNKVLTEEDPVEPALELARLRKEQNIPASEFFTMALGETVDVGKTSSHDLGEARPDLYNAYVENSQQQVGDLAMFRGLSPVMTTSNGVHEECRLGALVTRTEDPENDATDERKIAMDTKIREILFRPPETAGKKTNATPKATVVKSTAKTVTKPVAVKTPPAKKGKAGKEVLIYMTFQAGTSDKFYELIHKDCIVNVRYGRTGTNG
eukprot:gene22465-28591_t